MSRRCACSLMAAPRRTVKYAYPRRVERPTRPRSWYSCARPKRSASSTSSVFTFGMSSPLSMMDEHSSTSYSRSKKASIVRSSAPSGICPCAMATRASGTSSRRRRSCASMPCTRLHTTYACPPRASSRESASVTSASLYSSTNVCTG